MNGPSAHLSWDEMACRDGTEYPQAWRQTRAVELATAFERIRAICNFPLIVDSAYRTPAYNAQIGGARFSQHCEGRALDLVPAIGQKGLLTLINAAQTARAEGLIRGIGYYDGFVHVDCRLGQNATWSGSRTAIGS